MVEALVVTICLAGQPGCSSATTAYYQSNKELQQTVKNAEKFGKRLIKGHEYLVYVVTPFYAVAVGKPASFKLSRSWNLNIDIKRESIGLQWNY